MKIKRNNNVSSFALIVMVTVFVTATQLTSVLYLPSLPAIAADFQLSMGAAEATMTVYLLCFGLAQIIYGPIADHWGRRPVLLIGLLILLLGSLLSIFAGSLKTLMMTRAIQGFGAASAPILARAVIRDKFHGSQLASAMASLTMCVSLTPAVAPLIGGFLQHLVGWRGVFLTLSIYTAVILVAAFLLLPETLISEKSTWRFKKTASNYLQLSKHKAYMSYVVCIILLYSCQILYLTICPFIFQNDLGFNAAQYGAIIVIPALGYVIGGFIASRLTKHFHSDNILCLGAAIVACMGITLILLQWLLGVTIYGTIVPLIIMVIGLGLSYPLAISGSLKSFAELAGTAAAFSGFLQMLGVSAISGSSNWLRLSTPAQLGTAVLMCALVVIGLFVTQMRVK